MLSYIALVHTVDLLATCRSDFLFNWAVFDIQLASGFDVYKFVAWFLIPFAVSLPWLDWRAFTFGRWRKRDWVLLAALLAAGCGAMALIPLVPQLRAVYGGSPFFPKPWQHALWVASWLVGWEFLHRYALLFVSVARWPRAGWLVPPLAEGLYHLSKPPLEMAGMVALSCVLSYWAARRRNVLLPFLAHLAVEAALVAFLYA